MTSTMRKTTSRLLRSTASDVSSQPLRALTPRRIISIGERWLSALWPVAPDATLPPLAKARAECAACAAAARVAASI